jgi:cobaltochelatase CobS
MMTDNTYDPNKKPNKEISVREVFGIETDMIVKGFDEKSDRVPEIDETYKFDPDTTLAILAWLFTQQTRDDPRLPRHW